MKKTTFINFIILFSIKCVKFTVFNFYAYKFNIRRNNTIKEKYVFTITTTFFGYSEQNKGILGS